MMNFIKAYESFDESATISYDFDGCLHTSVVGLDPISFTEPEEWEPFEEVIEQMRKDAKDHRIIVTTARPPITNDYVWDFIRMHDLPVEKVIATDNMPKTPFLIKEKAIRHYDDNKKLAPYLKAAGIEFVLVDPIKRTQTLMESEGPLKNYVITFKNDKFYVSDRTIDSFVDKLMKMDPDLRYDPNNNGKGKGFREIMIRSSVLSHQDISAEIKTFLPKYEYLEMKVVATKYF